MANSPLISTSFQLDLADFGDQNNQIRHIQRLSTRFRGKIIGFDEILTGTWLDRARYRRFWLFFYVFRRVSASPEIDATCRKTDPRNPTLLTGRLRVKNLLPDLLQVGLRVGHKPDPPDLWTPLATRIDY